MMDEGLQTAPSQPEEALVSTAKVDDAFGHLYLPSLCGLIEVTQWIEAAEPLHVLAAPWPILAEPDGTPYREELPELALAYAPLTTLPHLLHKELKTIVRGILHDWYEFAEIQFFEQRSVDLVPILYALEHNAACRQCQRLAAKHRLN